MSDMMNGAKFFKQTVSFTDWLWGGLIILFMIVAIVTLIQKLVEILKKPMEKAKQGEEDHSTIIVTKQDLIALKQKEQKDVQQSQKQRTQISTALAQLKQIVLRDRCERIRSEIINFSSGVFNRNIRKDEYEHIFNIYKEYEQLLEETGMRNGEVDASMAVINQGYKQHLKKGFQE